MILTARKNKTAVVEWKSLLSAVSGAVLCLFAIAMLGIGHESNHDTGIFQRTLRFSAAAIDSNQSGVKSGLYKKFKCLSF